MKSFTKVLVLLGIIIFSNCIVFAQPAKKTDNWVNNGFTLLSERSSGVTISYSLTEFVFEEVVTDGFSAAAIRTPGVFLPNEAGAPDLPGTGRYIAMPSGATAKMNTTAGKIEIIQGVDIAPAPKIPLDTEPDALFHEKNERIYSTDAYYPENPVVLSEPMQIRGVDVVMLGVTPFQYNPVTRELIIYHDLQVEISFEGGNGKVGDDRLRSRWWDPVIKGAVLNTNIIPEMDYQVTPSSSRTPDYEYLIITPNLPEFLQWADSIKVWRTLQGIKTGVVTTTDIGGNTTTAIKNYINNAYNTWDVPPAAVLLLGDYSTGSDGIISYMYSHPDSYPDFASDNYFADVNNDNLPDIVFARITARDATELSVMISKFLNYEKYPPTDASFYHPITALGWQTSRWFQICSETIGGYFKNVHGMNPVRINALYIGNPSVDPWSTATNTSTVVNYFGPNGLGYIPATPQELGGFTGGTSTDVINAINNGSFLLQHRDHGAYSGWGEPAFYSSSINYLNNVNNKLPFVFSINCQTGAFHNSSECFTEKFHRHTYNGQNSGALGLIAATEVSYSFVNDTYVWGVFDNMFPDYMPDYTTTFPNSYAMPAFGNAAGKYFLQQSGWPYNSSDKLVTYRLFHHHGDAFMPIFYAVPQNLTVSHTSQHTNGDAYYTVTANEGAMIALTVSGEIIAVATGTGSALQIPVPYIYQGQTMIVTVTKQNYYRHSAEVDIINTGGVHAAFSGSPTTLTVGEGVTFTDMSYGAITTWDWSFPEGSPATYSGKNPPVIYYDTPGVYNVTLIVSDGTDSDTETKTGYITVNDIQYCASNGNASIEWIASVNIGGQVKSSGSSGSAGYEDHTNFVFTLEPGNSYGLTITPGYQGPSRFEYYTVWIDFNNDGDFLDAGEEVFNTSKKRNAVSGTINIPSGISVTTRMRVSMSREGLPSPCQIFSYGEVEDFTVEIQAPVPEPPVADFSANPLQVTVGQSVQFTDLSTNNPTAWAWSFPGGTPSSSASQNLSVTYNAIGTYDVSLTVFNAVGQDTETKTAYIEVIDSPPPPPPSSYCEPVAINNGPDYINSLTIGSVTHNSGKGSSGFMYYTYPVFNFIPGQGYSVSLVPYNSGNRNFWRIWIDFNGDGDFEDSGETLLTINNKKGTATGSISIPSTASGSTRMRISMKTGGSQLPCDDNFNGEVEDYDVNFNTEQAILASSSGQLNLQVYPNPAQRELNMHTSGNAGPVTIRVFNAQGTLIIAFEAENSSVKADISQYTPGLYFIVADDGTRVATEKLIIR